MLAANVCAADFLERFGHPALYRVHAGPSEEKLKLLREFLKTAGLSTGGGDKPQASDYAEVMDKIKSRPDAPMLQTMLLRSMQQAVYSPDNIGHFGLSYSAYTHFTSPIRRYPDLLVHRAIKAVLAHTKYQPAYADGVVLNTAIAPKARAACRPGCGAEGRTGGARAQRGDLGRAGPALLGQRAPRGRGFARCRGRLKCYFMRDKLGNEFAGTVSAVTSFGIFVQLDELHVEGLIHVSELGSDYFQYDEARNELRGERTGIRYRLTDRVRVQVLRVDRRAQDRLRPGAGTLCQGVARRPPACIGDRPHVPAAHASRRASAASNWQPCLAAPPSRKSPSTKRWTA